MRFGRLYKNRATAYLLDTKESAMSGTVTMLQDAISVSSLDMGINSVKIQWCVATVQVVMILDTVKTYRIAVQSAALTAKVLINLDMIMQHTTQDVRC